MNARALLDTTFLNNSLLTWLIALAVAALVYIALRVVRGLLTRRLSRLAGRTREELDDLIVVLLKGTRSFFLIVMALFCGSLALNFVGETGHIISSVVVIVLLVQAALWAMRLITFWLARERRKQVARGGSGTTLAALGFLSRIVVWALVVLLALSNIGVDVTALIAGLGITSIAVALALQGILKDLFASLAIVLDKPFELGDFLIFGDYLGTVEHVGIRSTRLQSLSGEQIVLSNSDLLETRIRNYKKMQERRIVFSIGVNYHTPRDKLVLIPVMIKEIIESQEQTRFDRSHFKEYGTFSLTFETVYHVLDPSYNVYMDLQQTINLTLHERFEEHGIRFAFPGQTVFLEEHEKAVPPPYESGASLSGTK